MEKKALGKGLEALLPDHALKKIAAALSGEVQELPLHTIQPNRYQPRTDFGETELSQLAESIKQNGIIQPVLVRRKGDGFYELIAGERRLRAAKLAGLMTIPAIVRNSSDEQTMELALVENLQRQDLNPMEAARAYHRLLNEFGFTQETVAQHLGKERSSIANFVRLINLPSEIQSLVESGALSTGHAKVLLALNQQEAQLKLARQIVENQLTVRQVEKMVATMFKRSRTTSRIKPYPDLEEKLQKRFGTKVSIVNEQNGGKIVLHYFAPVELDRLVEMLLG
jgi:ParB family transcriptional regulator, chromosome partitioning protein